MISPPDWLAEWENEYGFLGHPEKREDPGIKVCPQCEHPWHYMDCRKDVHEIGGKKTCGCPGTAPRVS